MDEGDPHQITDTRGILTLTVLISVKKRPEKEPQLTGIRDTMALFSNFTQFWLLFNSLCCSQKCKIAFFFSFFTSDIQHHSYCLVSKQ